MISTALLLFGLLFLITGCAISAKRQPNFMTFNLILSIVFLWGWGNIVSNNLTDHEAFMGFYNWIHEIPLFVLIVVPSIFIISFAIRISKEKAENN